MTHTPKTRVLTLSQIKVLESRCANKTCEWALAHKMRFAEAEHFIIASPFNAIQYARSVIGGRWPEAEAQIARCPNWAFSYAFHVVRGRWPDGEPAIATAESWSCHYATDVLRARFRLSEEIISQSDWAGHYMMKFPEVRDEWVLNGWLDWLDT